VLGFSSAGGRPRWGAHAARLQELPTGDDTYVMLWWLVGRQRFGGQIELFHHTSPAQRPRRPDWQPSDLGWSRFGVVVPDFDRHLRTGSRPPRGRACGRRARRRARTRGGPVAPRARSPARPRPRRRRPRRREGLRRDAGAAV